jgi:hypothetical protein
MQSMDVTTKSPMDSIFLQIEKMSQSENMNQDCNIFQAFLCESFRFRITSLQKGLKPEEKKMGELWASWLANPNRANCKLPSQLHVEAFQIKESRNECGANHVGLMTTLTGFGTCELERSQAFDDGMASSGESCNMLMEALERNKNCLQDEKLSDHFVVYGIGTQITKHDGKVYQGHLITLVQYPVIQEGELQMRYRDFQSYLNYYSLENQIAYAKEQHPPDGSFSHDHCITMIDRLKSIHQSKIWDNKTDALHHELFRVSLPDLLGEIITKPIIVDYYYRIQDKKTYLENIKNLQEISQQINALTHVSLLSDEKYGKKLEDPRSFCPLVMDLYFNT